MFCFNSKYLYINLKYEIETDTLYTLIVVFCMLNDEVHSKLTIQQNNQILL